MTTDAAWYAMNFITGEVGPAVEPPKRPRRADAAFTACVKLWGYAGQPLTASLRGKCNKARSEIVQYEREVDADVTLEEIAELIDGFEAWFKAYRRDRFNENCRRQPYPMETAVLWPEYRKTPVDIGAEWAEFLYKRDKENYELAKMTPGTAAYKAAQALRAEETGDNSSGIEAAGGG